MQNDYQISIKALAKLVNEWKDRDWKTTAKFLSILDGYIRWLVLSAAFPNDFCGIIMKKIDSLFAVAESKWIEEMAERHTISFDSGKILEIKKELKNDSFLEALTGACTEVSDGVILGGGQKQPVA